MVTTQLTALQGIALRARNRLALRNYAEFARQTNSAIALDRLIDQVFAQLQWQLDIVIAPTSAQSTTVAGSDTPLSSTDANNGFNTPLKDTQVEDEDIAHLKEALKKDMLKQSRISRLRVATWYSSEMNLACTRGASWYWRRKRRRSPSSFKSKRRRSRQSPLSRSSSSSSSGADSDHVLSSGMSNVSPASRERERAFSTFSTSVRQRGSAAPEEDRQSGSLPGSSSAGRARSPSGIVASSHTKQGRDSGLDPSATHRPQRVRLPQVHAPE